ncbi:hypothetical protein AB0H73_10335 [Streptomyces olivoreticuli]|uniref:hypothetical protein n=1 Tax=Streptomyces olivoreticuli TaxID=68246 RepID=UPI0013C2F2A5|nr:hypothetical protein [Streptomyces olivoreticuli]
MADEQSAPGIGEGPAKAISVSLPEGTVQALRASAGGRGVSAIVATAVEEHLRNQATLAYLDEFEQESGAFTAGEKQAAADIWAQAEEREGQWREAG